MDITQPELDFAEPNYLITVKDGPNFSVPINTKLARGTGEIVYDGEILTIKVGGMAVHICIAEVNYRTDPVEISANLISTPPTGTFDQSHVGFAISMGNVRRTATQLD